MITSGICRRVHVHRDKLTTLLKYTSSNMVNLHSTRMTHAEPPSTTTSTVSTGKSKSKAQKISKAMQSYLERSKANENMIKEQIVDYEIGKRHLANIMGEDPDSFTQENIDEAIKYLLPSGLFDKKARPLMKHPYEIFPRQKLAQFGMDGRPYHFLFYTGTPNYYQVMHDATDKLDKLKSEEDNMRKKGLPIEEKKVSLYGSDWMTLESLQEKMVEKFGVHDHSRFVLVMERLADHPLSILEEEFIMKYRRVLSTQTFAQGVQEPLLNEDGRKYMTAEGRRKTSRADVTVFADGSGQITINGRDLEYFENLSDYEQIMFPLQLVGLMDKVDIVAVVSGGGHSGQAGAVRHGLSKALTSFVDSEVIEKMRIAGLLQLDYRMKERKKPGQRKARKKQTWKKR